MSGEQPRVEQGGRFDFLRFAVGGGFFEHGGKRGEELHENRHGNFEH
jgi:hypothetical protein